MQMPAVVTSAPIEPPANTAEIAPVVAAENNTATPVVGATQ